MKSLKKISAVFLALLLAFSVMPGAFAKEVAYRQTCPYIYIHGFAGETIYDDPTSPDAKAVFPPSVNDIITAAELCAPSIGAYIISGNKRALSVAIAPVLKNLFSGFMLDRDGNRKNRTGVKFVWPDMSDIDETSHLEFDYDWRLDPMQTAAKLNDFINYVCEAADCDKVCIMAHSFGGIVALSYVSMYGTEKLQGIVMNSTAIYGETYTGEMFTGDLRIDMDALKAFTKFLFNDNDYEKLLNGIIGVMSNAGILDYIEKFGNDLIEDMYDSVTKEVLYPMFFTMPAVWAMVPDEYVNKAKDFVFGADVLENNYDYSPLKAKIQSYNTTVRDNRESILYLLERNGHFGVYSRYGYSSVPLTGSWRIMSDGIVDTKNTSFGATTANYGESLSEEYLKGKDPKYISPDKSVDASTCMFPEKTWFVKNFVHTTSTLLPELTMAILYGDEEVTADTYEDYPRFIVNEGEGSFVPEEPQKGEEKKSFFDKVKDFFNKIIELFKSFIAVFKKI